jgi:hypothetical protein
MDTAETFYGAKFQASPGVIASLPAAGWAAQWLRPDVTLPDTTADTPVLPVTANAGRWIVVCPYCASGQYAAATDHRFICVPGCGSGGNWLPVEWPEDQSDIEAALEPRPLENQNWLPGETVDDLLAENAAYLPEGGESD